MPRRKQSVRTTRPWTGLAAAVLVLAGLTGLADAPTAQAVYYGGGMNSPVFGVNGHQNVNSTWRGYMNSSVSAWNATNTPVAISTGSNYTNVVSVGSYSSSWFGLHQETVNGVQFRISLNSRTITAHVNQNVGFSHQYVVKSTYAHELGHSLFLGDNPATGANNSLMRHDRNRMTISTPRPYDIAEVNRTY